MMIIIIVVISYNNNSSNSNSSSNTNTNNDKTSSSTREFGDVVFDNDFMLPYPILRSYLIGGHRTIIIKRHIPELQKHMVSSKVENTTAVSDN